jgi:hypothetical protein
MKLDIFVGVNEGVVQIVELVVHSLALQMMLGAITVAVVVRLIRR